MLLDKNGRVARVFFLMSGFIFICLFSVKAQVQPTATATTVAAKTGTVTAYLPTTYPATDNINYVRTWTPQEPYTLETDVSSVLRLVTEVNHSTQYFDGLGRALQTVGCQASPSQKDIVIPFIYDAFGREQYKYLSYASTDNTGAFKLSPFSDQSTFYNTTYPVEQGALKNEQFYYSHTVYEPSPLERPLKTFAPGNSWEGSEVDNTTTRTSAEKAVSMQYLTNNSSDGVRIWDITYDPVSDINNVPASATGKVYGDGQLYKTVTIDEANNAVVEYKDTEGHLILKKVQIGTVPTDYSGYTNFLCTYYVYDDFDQLRFVIPPKAIAKMSNWTLTASLVKELCFRYEYDERHRMKAKKVPGADWVYMVYDSRDRLTFTQDGNLRGKATPQWSYTFYDDLNRPAETGIMAYTGTWANLIAAAANTANPAYTDANTGTFMNSLSDNLIISKRDYTISQYKANSSVTLQDGFASEDGANFTVLTGTGLGLTFSNSNTVSVNPLPSSGYTLYPLTYTYYDDYNGFTTNKTFTTTYNNSLDDGGNTAATLETLPSAATSMTKSTITCTRVKVIEDATDLGKGNWLETVSFYDDKGRITQAQSDNYKAGTDVSTMRYNFTGKVISTYLAHTNPAAGKTGSNGINLSTSFLLDHAGRIMNVKKGVIFQGSSEARTLVTNTYDALGQLKKKDIGQKSATNTAAMESDDYSYNVRGWLKGVNWYKSSTQAYASQVDNTQSKWFAFDLSYDWGFSDAGTSAAANQYNGNISGQRWKSAGDNKERAFGYGYDAANRLMKADFSQYNTSWGSDALLDFSVKIGDGATTTSAYDENGNILQMQQMGQAGITKQLIDNLEYHYTGTGEISNKLLYVKENGIQPTANIGDFNDKNGGMATDYGYDVNGNLITDLNKRMNGATGVDLSNTGANAGAILYNHLNLPYQITMKNDDGSLKGTITYIYDATGNKLEKRVSEAASSYNGNQSKQTGTAYINGFVYENNVLQFLSHEEGRVRMVQSIVNSTPTTKFVYDYFLKDHLGNTRMVLTDEQKQDVYPAATLEGNIATGGYPNAINTEQNYYSINTAKVVPKTDATGITDYPNYNQSAGMVNNNPNSNATANSASLYKLQASGAQGDFGLGITLKVMAGDRIDIAGNSYYFSNTTGGGSSKNIAVDDIINALFATPTGATSASKGVTASLLAGGKSNIPASVVSPTVPGTDVVPNAYINWIQLDERFQYVSSGASRVGTKNVVKTDHYLDLQNITIARNGYIYVYCSNQSPVAVYFDNLQVVHTKGPLTEETHYYPFGLTMAGISSQAAGSVEDKKSKFQGQEFAHKEFSDGNGLEMYEFKWRMDDPQLGRFWQVDPLSDKYAYNSTYAFSENKVASHVELEGKEAVEIPLVTWLVTKMAELKSSTLGARDATVRLATNTSGQEVSEHLSGAMKNIVNTSAKFEDMGKAVTPYLNILETVNTLASFTPIGEAGMAAEVTSKVFTLAGGSFKGLVPEVALNTEGKATLNNLVTSESLRNSFEDGNFIIVEAKHDIQVTRIYDANKEGSFFGLTTPRTSSEAESMYYLKAYDNNASQMTTATIKKGTQIAIGKVENGTGMQVYLPTDLQKGKVVYSKASVPLQ